MESERRIINAAVIDGEVVGSTTGGFRPEHLRDYKYAVQVKPGVFVFWPSFEAAGDLARRVVVETGQPGFLKRLGVLLGREYQRLPFRGTDVEPVFHQEPVPEELLRPPAAM